MMRILRFLVKRERERETVGAAPPPAGYDKKVQANRFQSTWQDERAGP